MKQPSELTDWFLTAQEAARRGAEVLESWRRRIDVREKGKHDLVTQADVESQQAVREVLLGAFAGHAFLGEEGDAARQRPGSDAPPTWIVDPLDGTTNYVHDCPMYCVSIGLYVEGELVVGVVYDPNQDEMFAAARGLGAWLNQRRLRTTNTAALDASLLASGFPGDMRGWEHTLAWWEYFAYRVRSLRRTGSTALNLAYVAAGRFDGFWAFDNKPWDVAAGAVLVREAGGLITNLDGSPFDPFTLDALATNGPLHPAMVEHLQGACVSPFRPLR